MSRGPDEDAGDLRNEQEIEVSVEVDDDADATGPPAAMVSQPSIAEIRAKKMVAIVVEDTLSRTGSHTAGLLDLLEKERATLRTRLEPLRVALVEQLEMISASFDRSVPPTERGATIDAVRERVRRLLADAASPEGVNRALAVSPTLRPE